MMKLVLGLLTRGPETSARRLCRRRAPNRRSTCGAFCREGRKSFPRLGARSSAFPRNLSLRCGSSTSMTNSSSQRARAGKWKIPIALRSIIWCAWRLSIIITTRGWSSSKRRSSMSRSWKKSRRSSEETPATSRSSPIFDLIYYFSKSPRLLRITHNCFSDSSLALNFGSRWIRYWFFWIIILSNGSSCGFFFFFFNDL